MSRYFNQYGGAVPLIVGDHSTHTIDSWRGQQPYNLSLHDKPVGDIVKYVTSPTLVHKLNPATRFVVMMRNPMSRFFSLYKFHVSKDPQDFHNGVVNGIAWWNACRTEGFPLTECLYRKPALQTYRAVTPCSWQRQATASIRKSLYHYYLNEWLGTFPRRQFLIFRFEDYVANTTHYLNEIVFPFLGLPALGGINKLSMRIRWDFRFDFFRYKRYSTGRTSWRLKQWPYGDMRTDTKRLLHDFYAPHNKRLATLLASDKYLWT